MLCNTSYIVRQEVLFGDLHSQIFLQVELARKSVTLTVHQCDSHLKKTRSQDEKRRHCLWRGTRYELDYQRKELQR